MHGSGIEFEQILRSSPWDEKSVRLYVSRAEAYQNECGCAMGGAFLAGGIVVFVVYVGFCGIGYISSVHRLAIAVAALLASAFIGKLTGIAVARIRLALLYRHLTHRRR